ncbi:MAG: hypothetical protein JWO36_5609 [Myxococcales bacterium]|nr:hypothetical protein [Myxococcales bacterium]
MRAAFVLILLAAGVAHAQPAANGFDHYLHDRDLFAGGKDPVPCGSCHVERAGRLVGKPDHASCFGACHGPQPTAPARGAKIREPDRVKICTSCHAASALVAPYTGKLSVGYPPYTIDPDFGLAIGHKQHHDVPCVQCHADLSQPAAHKIAHARCAGCHDGTPGHGPSMAKCAGCHPAASGSPLPPQLRAVHNTVTATFSHAKHAGRSAAGKDCATCHAAISKSDDTQLPRPTATDCATSGCHDGAKAFATTAACTRCHAQPPADKFDVERPTERFVHGGSHEQVMKQPCVRCHPVSSQREVLVGGHASCTGSTCHDADFGNRKPRICGACHNATEPWRQLVADRPPPEVTEFGATIDHSKHPGACTTCHKLRTTSAELRTPRGHAACASAGCHAVTGGPVPQLASCTACHERGLTVARTAKRTAAPWSVRTNFKHEPHRTSGELACIGCHIDLTAARVLDLAAPPKLACAPCHDGKTSFKLTGTQCARCHGSTHLGAVK